MQTLNTTEVSLVSAAGAGLLTTSNGVTHVLSFPAQSQDCVDAYLTHSQFYENTGVFNDYLMGYATGACGYDTVMDMIDQKYSQL